MGTCPNEVHVYAVHNHGKKQWKWRIVAGDYTQILVGVRVFKRLSGAMNASQAFVLQHEGQIPEGIMERTDG